MSRLIAIMSACLAVTGCGPHAATPTAEPPGAGEQVPSSSYDVGRPPPLVVQHGTTELELEPYTACWEGQPNHLGQVVGACWDGVPPDPSPDLGVVDGEFTLRFPLDGWTFDVGAQRAGMDCAQSVPAELVEVVSGEWAVTLAGPRAAYEVHISGHGPEGGLAVVFAATTAVDRPMPAPEAWAHTFFYHDGVPELTNLEMYVSHLASTPMVAVATATITTSDGRATTFELTSTRAPGDCVEPGSASLAAPPPPGSAFDQIGPPPYDMVWELYLGARLHVATATWPADIDAESGMIPLHFMPELPRTR